MRKINSKLTFFACSLMVLFWFLIMAAIFAPAFIDYSKANMMCMPQSK